MMFRKRAFLLASSMAMSLLNVTGYGEVSCMNDRMIR